MEQQTKHTPELRIHGDYSEIHPIFDEDGLIIIADIDPEKSLSYDQKKKYAELFAEAPTTAAERDSLKDQVESLKQLLEKIHDEIMLPYHDLLGSEPLTDEQHSLYSDVLETLKK